MAKAGRPKGTPKTGGRKRGTPNKRTEDLVERIKEAMGEDWCPIVALARIAEDEETSLDMRVKCLSEIAPYLQPKRKATEHNVGKTLEELVMSYSADQAETARERVAQQIAADMHRPVLQVVTGVPASNPEPQPAAAPATQPTADKPQPAIPEPKAPPRLTAITEDLGPMPPQDFDPYA